MMLKLILAMNSDETPK